MKYLNKTMILFLFMLTSFGRDSSAHTYTFVNMTGRDVKIQLFSHLEMLGQGKLIKAYDKAKFKIDGREVDFCLRKIFALGFDETTGEWIRKTGKIVPIRRVGWKLFDIAKYAIDEFEESVEESVKEFGRATMFRGAAEKKLKEAMDELVRASAATGAYYKHIVNFCRSANSILVLDYDPRIGSDRIYALSRGIFSFF